MYKIPKDLKVIILDLDDTLRGNYQRYKLDIHVKDILYYLYSSGIILALATLNPHADFLLKEYKVMHMFRYVFQNNFGNTSNNKVEMLDGIVQLCNIDKNKILYFDDSAMQVNRGIKFGIESICIKPLLKWRDIKYGFQQFNKKTRRYSAPTY
jgi:hydroxymethylpyrimidine pyrophosphatase-like HAD family hydrolase